MDITEKLTTRRRKTIQTHNTLYVGDHSLLLTSSYILGEYKETYYLTHFNLLEDYKERYYFYLIIMQINVKCMN
jgi:hypothetical protein